MKKILATAFALMCCCQAFPLEGRYGSGYYEFTPSTKNTKAEEMPMSPYKRGSLVFFRNDTAYMFYPNKSKDIADVVACPELMDLHIEGTFAYDERNQKIYYVKRTDANSTQIYEAFEKDGRFTGHKLLNIKGAMAEKNQIKGSTLMMGRYNFSHPGTKGFHNLSLAEKGKRLYFSGEFKSGKGGRDIYYIDKEKEGDLWSRPVPVNDTVNSQYTEDFPIVVGDTALYFSSNRPGGLGGMDFYGCHKRKNESLWNDPVNLGDVFNSAANDYNIAYNKSSMFFLSNRSGRKADIYYPEHYEFIFDKELAIDHTVEEPKGFNWVLFFFDYNKTESKPEYEVQMDELYKAMLEYPGQTFVVVGYTDNRGSVDYNNKLSQKRAEYVRMMLVNRGFPAGKLKAAGKGMDDPIVPDAQTEEEHEQNRRVEIKLLND